jgi:hypothetical protein
VTADPAHPLLAAAFAHACAARPDEVREATFSVGGAPVHARVAGSGLAMVLARSFAPGVREGGPRFDGLRLDIWDEQATGVPSGPRPRGDETIERELAAGERLAYGAEGRHVRFSGPDFDIRLDRDAQHAIGWVSSVARLSSWHQARPLQTLLLTWLADRGLTVVHAAMVARDGRGILLAAPSHSGKSTVTAICAAAGFDVLGDEAIALEVRGGRTYGHTVHAAVKLRAAGLERHPLLAGRTVSCGAPWLDETVCFLGEVFPQQVVPTARIAALGFPALADGPHSTFAPLRRGAGLRILTGCILSVEPGNVLASFEAVGAALAHLPAYRVSLGQDTARIPDTLDAVLGAAGATAAA